MNIFVVDNSPTVAANALHDRHIVKMALETAQILCTVAHGLGLPARYKPTHKNHPCTVWAGANSGNVRWLIKHGIEICNEYTIRFGRTHASEQVIVEVGMLLWDAVPAGERTPFAQVMPDEYRGDDAVEAYRRMYIATKLPGNRYTNATVPKWGM